MQLLTDCDIWSTLDAVHSTVFDAILSSPPNAVHCEVFWDDFHALFLQRRSLIRTRRFTSVITLTRFLFWFWIMGYLPNPFTIIDYRGVYLPPFTILASSDVYLTLFCLYITGVWKESIFYHTSSSYSISSTMSSTKCTQIENIQYQFMKHFDAKCSHANQVLNI